MLVGRTKASIAKRLRRLASPDLVAIRYGLDQSVIFNDNRVTCWNGDIYGFELFQCVDNFEKNGLIQERPRRLVNNNIFWRIGCQMLERCKGGPLTRGATNYDFRFVIFCHERARHVDQVTRRHDNDLCLRLNRHQTIQTMLKKGLASNSNELLRDVPPHARSASAR